MQILVNNDRSIAGRCWCIAPAPRAARAMGPREKELIPPQHGPDPDPGAIGGQNRARNRPRIAQGRHRKMLLRRHHAQNAQLLEKQKEGKNKSGIRQVDIPQEAFIARLSDS